MIYTEKGISEVKIAICDDKEEITIEMKKMLLSMKDMIESTMEIYIFNEAADFLYEIENDVIYDAVFMDIDLDGSSGIDLARKIYGKYPATMIVFITGNTQFVYDVFEVQPCGFIEKPISEKKVKAVFELIAAKCDELPKLSYGVGGKTKYVMLREIVYLKSEGRKIIVTGIKAADEFYGKLSEIEQKIQSQSTNFIRINQSYIVNGKYIKSISYSEIALNLNGEEIKLSISQKYRDNVKKWYIQQNID